MLIEFILLILGTYIISSFPLAYFIAKWSRGIDLREYGSGNVGMSNLMKFTSPLLAFPTIIFDIGKGALMVWVAQFLGFDYSQQAIVGVVAVIGHNWPVFLGFSGGRGILAALGVILALPSINGIFPWSAIIALLITGISVITIHNAPVGVLVALISLPLVSWAFSQPLPFTLGFVAIALISIIRRLTAPRFDISASVPTGQLLINRFFFDRDIKDARTWVNRMPIERSTGKSGGK